MAKKYGTGEYRASGSKSAERMKAGESKFQYDVRMRRAKSKTAKTAKSHRKIYLLRDPHLLIFRARKKTPKKREKKPPKMHKKNPFFSPFFPFFAYFFALFALISTLFDPFSTLFSPFFRVFSTIFSFGLYLCFFIRLNWFAVRRFLIRRSPLFYAPLWIFSAFRPSSHSALNFIAGLRIRRPDS